MGVGGYGWKLRGKGSKMMEGGQKNLSRRIGIATVQSQRGYRYRGWVVGVVGFEAVVAAWMDG